MKQIITSNLLATKKLDFKQSNFLWRATKLDDSIPLCNTCFKNSEYAISPESQLKYCNKLINKNKTKMNLSQLGFSVIDTPYSGLCSWEGVALSVLTDNPVYVKEFQIFEKLCLKGVIELVQLTLNDKKPHPRQTQLGKVLEVCMYYDTFLLDNNTLTLFSDYKEIFNKHLRRHSSFSFN